MPQAAQKVAFSVDGGWLADFAQQRVLEDRWDHAIRILETLQGIKIDQIITILKGDATLTGDSSVGIDLLPDDNEAYKTQLHYRFDGTWNNGGRFLRPYAIVTSWGPDDMVLNEYGARRRYRHNSMFYADRDSDVLERVKIDNGIFKEGDVLWKEVHNFPHLLMPSYTAAQDAIDAYKGTLPERGYLGGRTRMLTVDELANPEISVDPSKLDVDKPEPERTLDDRLADVRKIIPGYGYASLLPKEPTALELAEMGAKIRAAAGDDWIDFKVGRKKMRVPRAPFENWCLWRGDGAHLAMPWTPIAPSGLKMMGDDPYHTDFMLGAGLDLDAMRDHDSPLSKAIWDLRHKVQQEKLGFKVAVLCGTGTSSTLKVVHPKRNEECKPDEVAVIPNAGPHYVAAAMTAGAVITEQGGAMAHLVTVSREKDVKIVRIEKARELYPVGMHLVVDCAKGDVHVPFNRIDHKMKIMGQIIDVDELP